MNHQQFKDKRLGKRVDYDKAFRYQCVDLEKQYMADVLNFKPWTIGNAYDQFAKNTLSRLGFYKVDYSKWLQPPQWAIIFWRFWKYGHVAIVDKANDKTVTVIEQNGLGDNKNTKIDESWDWLGSNSIRERTCSYSNVVWRYIRE